MNNDRSLDHLIYDGMGQVRDGRVVGSVRPTIEETKQMKYVINQVMTSNYPYVAQSIGRDTMEEAIEVAVLLVMEQQDSDSETQVRDELRIDGFYIPTKHAEWSVCINEVMEKTAIQQGS
jgi:hypothetical protein